MTASKPRPRTLARVLIAGATLLGLVLACASFEDLDVWAPTVEHQDINSCESANADKAIAALLGLDNVEMVMAFREGLYEAHSRRGVVKFARRQERSGYTYELVSTEGENPLANQDDKAFARLDEELEAGSNPKSTDYREQDPGYSGPSDPRMTFVPAEKMSYPRAYERIAAFFDSPRAPDLMIEFKPYALYPLGEHVSAHGFLNALSSRGVLAFAGAGIKKGVRFEQVPASVDIAPTLARLLGFEKTFGVDATGHYSHDVYLKRQDGHVLEEILEGPNARASRAVIIVNDALTNSELANMLESDEPLPIYRWFRENGAWFDNGVIVNFPSNTYASHNTIGSGAWSGHHGLLDNKFYLRETGETKDPLSQVVNFGKFVTDEVETLHQAVHRNFSNWHAERSPLGNFTVSINSPSSKGADLAALDLIETYDWSRCKEAEEFKVPQVDPALEGTAQAADNFALSTFFKAFLGKLADGSKCVPNPRFAIINLAMTDDIAHRRGAHSDGLRRAIAHTDARMDLAMKAMKAAGAFEETVFVLTSDHGQVLQDHARIQEVAPALYDAKIGKFRLTDTGVYLLDCIPKPEKPDGGGETREECPGALFFDVLSPAGEATEVPVESLVVHVQLSRPAAISADGKGCAEDPRTMKAWLENEQGEVFPGRITYSATNNDVKFSPFGILESRTHYRFVLQVRETRAETRFTTAEAYEGALPPVAARTFALTIADFQYPEQLQQLFNSLKSTMPPILINMNELAIDDPQAERQTGRALMVGGMGDPETTPPDATLGAEIPKANNTSTALTLSGRLRGRWLLLGPGEVHLTASGVPLVFREFVTSGVISEDGKAIEEGVLTGVISVQELGEALDIDLSSICSDPATKEACDDAGNIRMAAKLVGVENPLAFAPFITSPVNKSVGNPPDGTVIEVYFNEPADQAATSFELSVCDESGIERPPSGSDALSWSCNQAGSTLVAGEARFVSDRHATFTPSAPLPSGVWLRFGVEAQAAGEGGGADARHVVFKTE